MTVAERDEVLRVVKDQATAAADIIADLLVAARADIGGVAVTHDAVDVESEIGRILAGQNEQVTVSGGEALPAVCADAGRVQQVLRNLLTNAIRYGGPERRVLCATTGDRVSIEVRDDGQDLNGIHLDALFEPYARAHESAGITESVGLGLTVSRQLAYAMNGTLTAFRDGHETVFRLELPVWGRCATNDSRQSAAV
jgi:two-component system sensor histidine kinase KdpD